MSAKPLIERARAIKDISLRELERSDSSSVFVVNNMKERGHINFSVVNAMGRVLNVRVPICGIPVDLSFQAVKEAIVQAPDFRQLIAKKALLLKNEDEALEFFKNNPEAVAEADRVNRINNVEAVASPEDVDSELGLAKAEAVGEISPFVIQLVIGSDHSEDEALADLRAREHELQLEDYSYIAAGSRHEKVKAWAAEHAVQLQQKK